jgi:outer membrane protein assembly factor BamB
LASTNVFSQKNQIQVSKNIRVIGSNWVNASHIEGTELLFSERIYKAYLDTSTNLLTVQLRKTNKKGTTYKWFGNIVQYDMENDKILWTKDINYKTSYIKNHHKTIILTENAISYSLDVYTGNIKWGGTHNIYFADPEFNIALGYRSGYYDKELKVLEGINLKNGRTVWKRELSREMGWNNQFFTNDSTLLITAKGLHNINLKTGKGWDFHTVIHEFEFSNYGHPLLRNYGADMWVDSTSIYFKSKNEVARFDKETGDVVWKAQITKNNAGGSFLIMADSVIYLLHKGYDNRSYDLSFIGAPFIAAFDRETGEQKYIVQIKIDQIPILAYDIFENEIYLLSKNKITKHDLITGNLLVEKSISKDSLGIFKYFASDKVFIEDKDGHYLSLWQYDSTKMFILNQKHTLFSVDKELNVQQIKEEKDLYLHYLSTDEYNFFSHDDITIIQNKAGKLIAKIALSSGAIINYENFYAKVGKSLMIFDLKDI